MTDQVFAWLRTWQQHINDCDYAAARSLFARDVVAFGTVTGIMHGLRDLESMQWRQVWPTITDFRFDLDTVAVFADPGAKTMTVTCLWRSLGREGPSWYDRGGRMTLVLQDVDGSLVCRHSHFSMEPGIPPLASAEPV